MGELFFLGTRSPISTIGFIRREKDLAIFFAALMRHSKGALCFGKEYDTAIREVFRLADTANSRRTIGRVKSNLSRAGYVFGHPKHHLTAKAVALMRRHGIAFRSDEGHALLLITGTGRSLATLEQENIEIDAVIKELRVRITALREQKALFEDGVERLNKRRDENQREIAEMATKPRW